MLASVLWWCGSTPPLVLGTFNIRTFPGERTDLEAVAGALAELDADAIAVQEIVDVRAFERVLERAGELADRRYAATFVSYCHAGEHGQMHIGVVYDRDRLELRARRALTPGEACPRGRPPGLVAHLRPSAGAAFVLASVHFKAGGLEADQAERRRQWTWLARALPGLAAELSAPVIVAGDFNSTGFLEPDHAERRFIDGLVAEHGLRIPTRDLACSMYWTPSAGRYAVSLLDHVLGPADLELARAKVLGMCAALACAPQDRAPAGFDAISDHCPIRVELRR